MEKKCSRERKQQVQRNRLSTREVQKEASTAQNAVNTARWYEMG